METHTTTPLHPPPGHIYKDWRPTSNTVLIELTQFVKRNFDFNKNNLENIVFIY